MHNTNRHSLLTSHPTAANGTHSVNLTTTLSIASSCTTVRQTAVLRCCSETIYHRYIIATSSLYHHYIITISSLYHRYIITTSCLRHHEIITTSSPYHHDLIAISSPHHVDIIAISSSHHHHIIAISSLSHRYIPGTSEDTLLLRKLLRGLVRLAPCRVQHLVPITRAPSAIARHSTCASAHQVVPIACAPSAVARYVRWP